MSTLLAQSGRQWNQKYIIHVQLYLQQKCACAVLAVNDTFPNYIFTEIFLCTNVSYVKFTEGCGYNHSLAKATTNCIVGSRPLPACTFAQL